MRSRRLKLEALEGRDVPSATTPTVWGTPWPDAEHLTMSFAPDGTNIAGDGSTLSQVFATTNAGELTTAAELQMWAQYANINIGIVPDDGAAFGTGKPIQGDTSFGDIRVGARPLAGDVVALTSPFDYNSSYSGDVVLNSSQSFSTYNLNAVALHEMGHALGLPDNNDPTSVMYEYYDGNTTLSASDIAAIQSLYGVRVPNTTSDTMATAINYTAPVYASLNTPTDADFYKFTTPLLFTGTTVHLQAEGLSLLDAQVLVLNSRGTVVASAVSGNPLANDLTLSLNNLSGLSTYYVEVNSPNGWIFDVGSYNLTITNNFQGDLLNGQVNLFGNVGNSFQSAFNLNTQLTTQNTYTARSTLNSSQVADYEIQAPAASSGTLGAMVLNAWSLTNTSLTPHIGVFTSSGVAVGFQVLTSNPSTYSVQVINPVAGADYYLKVSGASGQSGNYTVSADFLASAVAFPMTATGTLTSAAPSTSASLSVTQSQIEHFVLSVGTVSSDPNTTLTMTITNSSGTVVATLQATAGNAESLDVFLSEGTYTVTVSASSDTSGALQNVTFSLDAISLTDPVAVQSENPSEIEVSAAILSSCIWSALNPSGNTTWIG